METSYDLLEKQNLELGDELKAQAKAEEAFSLSMSSEILPSVKRVYNNQLGFQDVNTDTGEVVRSRASHLQAIDQVGTPDGPIDVGAPLVEHFTSSYDIKENLKKLFNNDAQKLASVLYAESDDVSEDEALAMLDDDDDDDALNVVSESSPYAVGADGLSNLERHIQKQGHNVEDFRNWLEKKDHIPKELLALSEDELKSLMAKLAEGSETPTPAGEGEGEGG